MTTTPETPNSGLATRLKSALVLGVGVMIVLAVGGGGFAILMAAAAGIGGYEWARMVSEKTPLTKPVLWLSALAAGLGAFTEHMAGSPLVSVWFLLSLMFLVFAYNYTQKDSPKPYELLKGIFYIGFSVQVMIWIRGASMQGLYDMLVLLFIVWASDSCAYFTGRAIGGPKLAPAISPKKTWSGFVGSSVGAGLAAGAMACPWVVSALDVQTIMNKASFGYFILGFVLAMVGQAGDLLVSHYKRYYGVKDTGAIIPGHGGVLDRIDALMLVALVYGFILAIAG